jgi:hypothetical protein
MGASMGMGSLGSGIGEHVSPPQGRSALSHASHDSALRPWGGETCSPIPDPNDPIPIEAPMPSPLARPAHSAHPSFYSDTHSIDGRYSSGSMDLTAGFNKSRRRDERSERGVGWYKKRSCERRAIVRCDPGAEPCGNDFPCEAWLCEPSRWCKRRWHGRLDGNGVIVSGVSGALGGIRSGVVRGVR